MSDNKPFYVRTRFNRRAYSIEKLMELDTSTDKGSFYKGLRLVHVTKEVYDSMAKDLNNYWDTHLKTYGIFVVTPHTMTELEATKEFEDLDALVIDTMDYNGTPYVGRLLELRFPEKGDEVPSELSVSGKHKQYIKSTPVKGLEVFASLQTDVMEFRSKAVLGDTEEKPYWYPVEHNIVLEEGLYEEFIGDFETCPSELSHYPGIAIIHKGFEKPFNKENPPVVVHISEEYWRYEGVGIVKGVRKAD